MFERLVLQAERDGTYETETRAVDKQNENLEAFTVETEGETVFILT